MENPPQEPTPEEIDADIEKLLENLESYNELYNGLNAELQEQWYWVEMEARVAEDRKTAKKHLEEFIRLLAEIRSRQGG